MTKMLIKHNIDVIITFIKTLPLFSLTAVHIIFSPISFYLCCSSGTDINEKNPKHLLLL